MRRFLVRTFVFALVLFTMLAGCTGFLVWYAKHNHMYIDGYGQKERLLADTPSPRIIFQGGSNVAFGIDSKAVEDSVARNTINNGIIFTLGLSMMLSELSEFSREGDIIVIAPEYEFFYGYADGTASTLATVTLLYPKITRFFNTSQMSAMAKGLPDAFKLLSETLLQKIINGSNDYSYSSLSFNAHGDEERHWAYSADDTIIPVDDIPGKFDEEYFEKFCSTLDDFETQGVDIIIIPPAVYSKLYDNCREKMNYLEERLRTAGRPFAYAQSLSVYETSDMFDSQYHLSKSGIDKRMVLIIDALRRHIRAKSHNQMAPHQPLR